jgi:hypothetical protein
MIKIRLIEIELEHYVSTEDHHIRREEGYTPNGNQFGGRWVLRDKDFVYIDHDQYRHDLMARHGFDDMPITLKQHLEEQFA